jgi:hypothetical protein
MFLLTIDILNLHFKKVMSNSYNRMIVFTSILAAILATGLLALNPSTITSADAQMYANDYGYDNNYYQDDNRYSYDKKDPKSFHTDIQKIKCVNSNINVNGIDITEIPQDNTALGAANEGAADATGAQNGNGWGDRINFERNLVNICVNVNDNEQVKVSPPPSATLAVTKTVSCTPIGTSPEVAQFCQVLLGLPDNIRVTGNNPNPSEFAGSSSPVVVTLGAWDYEVTEVVAIIFIPPNIDFSLDTQFAGDCTEDPNNELSAKGTIAVGESQTCDISNDYTVRLID